MLFRQCGLLLWLVGANMTITKTTAKENLWECSAFPLLKQKRNEISGFSFVIVSVRVVIKQYCCDPIIASPETFFQELISDKFLILLRDRPCLELTIASSTFQALVFLQDKLLESV